MDCLLAEKVGFKQAAVPADLNTLGLTGARIKLDKGSRLAIVATMGDSTAAVVNFTLRQHDAASGGNSKDLASKTPYYTKAAAETSFTKVSPTTAAASKDLATQFASQEGIAVFEVQDTELDTNNGFAWVSVNVADPTAAKIFAIVYCLHEVIHAPASELVL